MAVIILNLEKKYINEDFGFLNCMWYEFSFNWNNQIFFILFNNKLSREL